eukprot:XP_001702294.1 predicted protein [Chlamydomonas reinhardtii]
MAIRLKVVLANVYSLNEPGVLRDATSVRRVGGALTVEASLLVPEGRHYEGANVLGAFGAQLVPYVRLTKPQDNGGQQQPLSHQQFLSGAGVQAALGGLSYGVNGRPLNGPTSIPYLQPSIFASPKAGGRMNSEPPTPTSGASGASGGLAAGRPTAQTPTGRAGALGSPKLSSGYNPVTGAASTPTRRNSGSLASTAPPGSLAGIQRMAAGGTVIQLFGTWRIDGSLAVARAIGDADFSRYVSYHPTVSCRQLARRDRWLVIASDGLWDVMSNEEVAMFCRAQHQLSAAKLAEALVREAVRNRGSGDNTTVVAVRLQYNPPPPAAS